MLFHTNSHLVTATVTKYRELLRKLNSNAAAADEGSSTAFQQAKERVIMRVTQRQGRDRVGLLQRLQDRLSHARHSLCGIKDEQKQRLQQYYIQHSLSTRSGAACSVHTRQEGVDMGSEPDAATLAAATDSNSLFRAFVISSVGGACKLFLAGAAHTTVEGAEVLHKALERPPGQPLITVSNHVASMDDPLVTAALVPPRYLLRPQALRWTLCATDRCFRYASLSPFFRAGKVLPVERGSGVGQFGMRVAADRLRAGDWVHMFPEGTRGSGKGARMLPARRGVGWLVASCDRPPLVVPFVHSGMERVVPRGKALPRPGQRVRILVGEPVPLEDLLATAREEAWSEQALHCAVADRVGCALYELRARLEGVGVEEVAPERGAAARALQDGALLPLIEEEMERSRKESGWKARWEALGLASMAQQALGGALQPTGSIVHVEPQSFKASALHSPPTLELEPQLRDTMGMLRGTVKAARTRLKRVASSLGTVDGGGLLRSTSAACGMTSLTGIPDDSSLLRVLMASAAEYSMARTQHMRELLTGCSTEAPAGRQPSFTWAPEF